MSTEPIRRVTVAERTYRVPRYAGSRAELLCDPSGPVTELRAGVVAVEPGSVVPLHYHKRQTLELVLSGCAVVQGRDGREWPVGPGDTMLFAAGPEAAHRWRITGNLPVVVLFVYPTPGAEDDELTWLESGAGLAAPSSPAGAPDRP